MILLIFFNTLFSPILCLLGFVAIWKKKKGNLVKAGHGRVFHLVRIQWACHTNSLLSNFQKDSMFSGVEKLEYVT